ncbi:MAG: hypothetical protein C0401_07665 [Anaerolinea sp.]|nr:hypothetical protein [Anaerolinea sp.]
MIYTPFMMEKIRSKRNLLFIVFGVLLIALGIGGNILTLRKNELISTKGTFRYIEKIGIEEIIVSSSTVVSVQPTGNGEILNTNDLSKFSYYIHSSVDPKLESPMIPDRIEIPAIKLVAPVVVSDFNYTKVEGETFGQWVAPSEYSAAWQPNSAPLGQKGNTVINGHHNEFGEVFGKLVDLKEGDLISVYSQGEKFTFIIANRMILPERWQKAEVRLENAKWLGKSKDVRLTLVTCWPADSNTHRLILVARPY